MSDGSGYVDSLLTLLGRRDPLAVQAELLPWLERRVAGLPDAAVRAPEAAGKWSVLEVVQHLADTELVYGYRIRMVLTHDNWPIEVYDREAWARDLHYSALTPGDALDQLRSLRSANLRLYRSLSPGQLARAGLHSARGAESVSLMIGLLAGHDLTHRRQIDRILDGR